MYVSLKIPKNLRTVSSEEGSSGLQYLTEALSTPMPKETVAAMTGTLPSIHSSCTLLRSLAYSIHKQKVSFTFYFILFFFYNDILLDFYISKLRYSREKQGKCLIYVSFSCSLKNTSGQRKENLIFAGREGERAGNAIQR